VDAALGMDPGRCRRILAAGLSDGAEQWWTELVSPARAAIAARTVLARPGDDAAALLEAAALAVLRNPLIIGCLLGILALKSETRLPQGLFNALNALGQAALPCALLALGASLTPARMRASFGPALAGTALKLLAMPAIGYAAARAAGFSGELLVVALLFLASPCAVTSYVMADQMGADKELAGSAVALSTLLCLPVMAVLLLLFQH